MGFVDEPFACFGITNHCKPGKRLIFLDYDTKELEHVMLDVRKLYDVYKHFILIETLNGYHVYILTPVEVNEWFDWVMASNCDEMYKEKARKKLYTTLRVTPKFKQVGKGKFELESPAPDFLYAMFKPSELIKLSYAHVAILSHLYRVNLFEYAAIANVKYIKDTKVQLVYYHTRTGRCKQTSPETCNKSSLSHSKSEGKGKHHPK